MSSRTACRSASKGFTLLELMLVLLVLGLVAGLSSLGLQRIDPGSRGVQATVRAFLETTRDQARRTGRPAGIELVAGPSEAEGGTRLVRHLYRTVMEGSFEPGRPGPKRWRLDPPARIGGGGRFGGGLDLRGGGGAALSAAGSFVFPDGFSVEFDFLPAGAGGGTLLDWKGLLAVRITRGGGLGVELRSGKEEEILLTRFSLSGGAVRPDQWHHLRLTTTRGRADLFLDGRLAGTKPVAGTFPSPEAPLYLGDPEQTFHGRLDEFVLQARVREESPPLPAGVTVEMSAPRILFDGRGRLQDPRGGAISVKVSSQGDPVGEFRVGRFTQEEQTL
ncbi:MAG: LamG-like jellyroll fold domain-containing protein [Planctomycetota bacterium]